MWLNWDAARVLDMLKGSYLFDADPARIIQDNRRACEPPPFARPRWERVVRARRCGSYFRSIHPTTTLRCMSDLGPRDFLGACHPADDEILREGRGAESWSARIHCFECELGSRTRWPQLENFGHRTRQYGRWRSCCASIASAIHLHGVKARDVLPAAAGHFSGYTPVALQTGDPGLTNPVAPVWQCHSSGPSRIFRRRLSIKVQHGAAGGGHHDGSAGTRLLERVCGWMCARHRTPTAISARRRPAHGTALRKSFHCKRSQ